MKKQVFTTVEKRQKLRFVYPYLNVSKRNFRVAIRHGLYLLPSCPPYPYAPPA